MGKFLEENLIDSMDEKSKGTILRAMAVFVAIEVCGSFLTGKTGRSTTRDNFITFCKSKYIPKKYHKISELLYEIFRNGVAHSYVPKGGAHLTSDPRARKHHICFEQDGLFIHVLTLAGDVTNAIKNFVKDLKKNKLLQKNYYTVLQQLDEYGKEKYRNFIRQNKIKTTQIPVRGDIYEN